MEKHGIHRRFQGKDSRSGSDFPVPVGNAKTIIALIVVLGFALLMIIAIQHFTI